MWLLAAVGLWKLWDWAGPKQQWVRPLLAGVLGLMLVVNLVVNLPGRMADAHGFYGITRAQLAPIEEAGLQNALVIVYAERWLEYGAMLAGMSPLLDDDVVYARGGGVEFDEAVIAQYAGRSVFYLKDGHLTRSPSDP